MIRGIERKKIFRDNKDRNNLLERISSLIPILSYREPHSAVHFNRQSGRGLRAISFTVSHVAAIPKT
jgi:hypothetical protein